MDGLPYMCSKGLIKEGAKRISMMHIRARSRKVAKIL